MSQARPTINELLLVVQRFVADSARALEGQNRFHALSSAYVLGICERELRLGPGNDREELECLSRFLQSPDASLDELREELCSKIRAGALDSDSDAVLDMLLAQSVRDVGIVKPEHLAFGHRASSEST